MLRLLPKGRFANAVMTLVSGTALGQLVMIGVSPLLTRLYSPQEFGVLSLYMAVIGVLGIASAGKYETAIPIADTEKDASALAVLSIIIVMFVSLSAWCVLELLWGPIARTFELSALKTYTWMVPLGVVSIGLFNLFTMWATRDHLFRALAFGKFSQGAGTAGFQVGAGWLGSGVLGLIAGDLAGRLIGVLLLVQKLSRDHWKAIEAVEWRSIMANMVRFRRFPLLSAPAAFCNTLGLRLPVILMGSFYGLEAAGWLMLSQRLLGAPVTLVAQAVSRVYVGEISKRIREDSGTINSLFLATSVRLTFLCGPPALIFAVIAPDVFEWAFGVDWYVAGEYTRYLSLMLVFQFVVVPLSQTLTLLERQNLQLIWDVTRLAVVVGGFVIMKALDLNSVAAIVGFSISMVFMYLLLWILSWRVLSRYGC